MRESSRQVRQAAIAIPIALVLVALMALGGPPPAAPARIASSVRLRPPAELGRPFTSAMDTLPVLGWYTNIARRQGADSLELLYAHEAPGANTVFIGTGGIFRPVRGSAGPEVTRTGDPIINLGTLERTLRTSVDSLGLHAFVSLPFEPGWAASRESGACADSLRWLVRWILGATSHPERIVGWGIADEPNESIGCPGHPDPVRTPAAALEWERRVVREADPDSAARPVLTILFGCAGEGMDADSLARNYYRQAGPFDRLMVDHYAAPSARGDATLGANRPVPPGSQLALAWKVAPGMRRFPGRPWIAVLQGFNISEPDSRFDPWAKSAEGSGHRRGAIREADSVGCAFATSRAALEYKTVSALVAGAHGVIFYGGFPRDAETQTGAPYATAGFRKRAVAPLINWLGLPPAPGAQAPIAALLHGPDAAGTEVVIKAETDSLHWRAARSRDGRVWVFLANDRVARSDFTLESLPYRLRIWDGTRGPAFSPALEPGHPLHLTIPGLTSRIYLLEPRR